MPLYAVTEPKSAILQKSQESDVWHQYLSSNKPFCPQGVTHSFPLSVISKKIRLCFNLEELCNLVHTRSLQTFVKCCGFLSHTPGIWNSFKFRSLEFESKWRNGHTYSHFVLDQQTNLYLWYCKSPKNQKCGTSIYPQINHPVHME